MGKRFLFGLCLFLLLPLFGIFACNYLYTTHIPLYSTMEAASTGITEEAISEAEEKIENVKHIWRSHKKTVSAISAHSIPEQIRQEFSRLDIQLSDKEYSHAAQTCRILSSLFHSLGADQLPVWWNIL